MTVTWDQIVETLCVGICKQGGDLSTCDKCDADVAFLLDREAEAS